MALEKDKIIVTARPTALAGTALEVKEGEQVVLDGSGSASENGNIASLSSLCK